MSNTMLRNVKGVYIETFYTGQEKGLYIKNILEIRMMVNKNLATDVVMIERLI